jgi:hypothetical protein
MLTDLTERLDDATRTQPFVPDATRALARARRLRRRRHVTVGASLVVLVGLTVASGIVVHPLGSGRHTDSVVSDNTVPTPVVATPSLDEVRHAVLVAYFPVSGTEITDDWAHGLTRYSIDLTRDQEPKECTVTPNADDEPPHFHDFPDLDLFARNGIVPVGYQMVPPALKKPCSAALLKVRAIDPLVTLRTTDEGKLLESAFAQLLYSPTSELRVNRNPTVAAAYATVGTCAHAHGVAANNEEDFFRIGDQLGQAATPNAGLALTVGRVYAMCMAPVVAARTPLLTDLRDSFIREHAAQIGSLDQNAYAVIGQTIRTTGVAWSPMP